MGCGGEKKREEGKRRRWDFPRLTSCSSKSEGTTATPVSTSISESTDRSVGIISGTGGARLHRPSSPSALILFIHPTTLHCCTAMGGWRRLSPPPLAGEKVLTPIQQSVSQSRGWSLRGRTQTHFFLGLRGTAGSDVGVRHCSLVGLWESVWRVKKQEKAGCSVCWRMKRRR